MRGAGLLTCCPPFQLSGLSFLLRRRVDVVDVTLRSVPLLLVLGLRQHCMSVQLRQVRRYLFAHTTKRTSTTFLSRCVPLNYTYSQPG